MFRGPATVLGFGELGTCLVGLLRAHDVPTHVWRRPRLERAEAARGSARDLGALLHSDLAAAVTPSAVVFLCVPGTASLAVASEAAAHLQPGTLFVDAATAPPEEKQRTGQRVEAAGGAYVDAAITGSVAALGAQVPWLVAGPHVGRFVPVTTALDLRVTVLDAPVGAATRVKLLRSVYLKGRDALVTEMALAAHAYGLLPQVVGSIGGPAEQVEFGALAQRILRSTARHSGRRSAELQAAADVLRAAGVSPLAVQGALRRIRSLSAPGARAPGLEQIADEIDADR